MGERLRSCRLDEEGSNLVEFALILPPLMMLLTGIVSFGSAMMNYEQLTHGVAEGAQALVLSRQSGTATDPCATTFSALTKAAPTLKQADIVLTITLGSTTKTGPTCDGSQSAMVMGQSATVNATYPCNIGVYGITISPGCRLTATLTEYEF
jgi:Flp pilus assembly protein TadG